MYASAGIEEDNAGIAKQLSLEEEDVLKAWNYWESLGVIKKKFNRDKEKFHYDVEFLCIKEQLYGKKVKGKSAGDNKLPKILNEKELEALYRSVERITGRVLGGTEPVEIISWIDDYGASPEVIEYAYSYCVKNKKKDNHKYVGSFIKGWMEKQLTDTGKIENYLKDVDERHYLYKRVLKALGFSRNATEKDKQIMDTWFDDMGFPIATVLEACGKTSGIPNPNFNYVNGVLLSWYAESKNGKKDTGKSGKKNVSVSDVYKYYDFIRKQAEDDAAERKNRIYIQIPKIKKIDEELRKCVMDMLKTYIPGSADKGKGAAIYKDMAEKLSGQKAELLKGGGYSADYLETKYRCALCKDTGINDNDERCDCFKEVLYEAELWKNSTTK
jgi:DnaD/phage-associated family protein